MDRNGVAKMRKWLKRDNIQIMTSEFLVQPDFVSLWF